jgi:hypothetical protein
MDTQSLKRLRRILAVLRIVALTCMFASLVVGIFVWHLPIEGFTSILLVLVLYLAGTFLSHEQGKQAILRAGKAARISLILFHLYASLNQGLLSVLLAFVLIAAVTFEAILLITVHLLHLTVTPVSIVFITLTSTSVLMSFFGNSILRALEGLLSFGARDLNPYALYIAPQNRIRIGLFLLYFILIIAVSFMHLNGRDLFGVLDLDMAVIQSFVALVAFDRINSNWKGGIRSHVADGTPMELSSEVRKHMQLIRDEFNKEKLPPNSAASDSMPSQF